MPRTFCLQFSGSRWVLTEQGFLDVIATYDRQKEPALAAVEAKIRRTGGTLKIFHRNGTLEETREFPPPAILND